MGGTLDSWDQGLGALNNGRQVLRYDTRGAGLSEKIAGVVTWNDMADDLKALLDALNIAGKVAIAGIAVGAAIGVHFAVRNPERVAALVLHGPAPGVSADRRQQTLERAAAVEAGGMRGVVKPVSRTPTRRSCATTPTCLTSSAPVGWPTIRRASPPSTACSPRRTSRAKLSKIACPTLVTAGRHDGLRPPSIIEPMAKQIPGAEFLELNTGHFASIQTPGTMSQAIHYFLHALGL